MSVAIKDKLGNSAKIVGTQIFINGTQQIYNWQKLYLQNGYFYAVRNNNGIYRYTGVNWKYTGNNVSTPVQAQTTQPISAISNMDTQRTASAIPIGANISIGQPTETFKLSKVVIFGGGAVILGIVAYISGIFKSKKRKR